MARKDISDKQVCEAYAEYRRILLGQPCFIKWPYEILHEMTGQPEKVCYAAMERAHARGYVEYGVSLRAGFLTDKGMDLLKGSRP